MPPSTTTTTTSVAKEGSSEPRNEWGRTAEEERKRNLCIQSAKNDMNAPRREFYFTFEKIPWLDNLVNNSLCDHKDKPVFNMLMNTSLVSLPLLACLFRFCPNTKMGHLFGFAYFMTHFVLFLHSFILALHYSTHRRLMKQDSPLAWFNKVPLYILCPTFGLPSGIYYLHHIVMHHCHDNCIPYDISSSEPYQRDNLLHFGVYWFRFWATVWVELPFFAFRTGLYKYACQGLCYFVVYFSYLYNVWQYNPVVATWGIIAPFFFTQTMLAYGNFGQHQFVEGGKPSNYRSTYNVVDCFDNTKSFQDGYHVLHHLNSRNHWSLFPETFIKQVDRMNEEKALTFVGIGFFEASFWIYMGRLDILADKAITPWDCSKEELIELMKERLKPISQTAKQRSKIAGEAALAKQKDL